MTHNPFDAELERGMRNRRQILGDAWVDRSIGQANAFTADFQAFITRYAWHEVWGRPGLDRRTRRLLVLVITASLGRWEEFELHCRAALAGGEPETRPGIEEIREALIQTAIYASVPAANTAHAITARLLRDLGASDLPQAADFAAAVAPRPATQTRHPGTGEERRTAAADGPVIAYSLLPPQAARADGAPPRTVLLSHALGADRMMWDDLALHLARDHRVIRHDHRGHGESAVPPGPYTLEQLADDAARVIDAELPPGEGVLFIGLSLGGMVGQCLALRRPDRVAALVLANTTSGYPAAARAVWRERIDTIHRQGLGPIAEATMQRWFTPAFQLAQPATVARLQRRVASQDAAGYAACCEAIAALDLTEQLPRITCPALVIAGAQDQGTPPEMGREIAHRIPGARFELLEGAAHQSVLEQPAAFQAVLRDWMATLSTPR
jgi:3-oxoadipate enol-lactonase